MLAHLAKKQLMLSWRIRLHLLFYHFQYFPIFTNLYALRWSLATDHLSVYTGEKPRMGTWIIEY